MELCPFCFFFSTGTDTYTAAGISRLSNLRKHFFLCVCVCGRHSPLKEKVRALGLAPPPHTHLLKNASKFLFFYFLFFNMDWKPAQNGLSLSLFRALLNAKVITTHFQRPYGRVVCVWSSESFKARNRRTFSLNSFPHYSSQVKTFFFFFFRK